MVDPNPDLGQGQGQDLCFGEGKDPLVALINAGHLQSARRDKTQLPLNTTGVDQGRQSAEDPDRRLDTDRDLQLISGQGPRSGEDLVLPQGVDTDLRSDIDPDLQCLNKIYRDIEARHLILKDVDNKFGEGQI